ncbi:MAG TPA: beta-ketoacyl-ACP synthase III [Candidatus Hydrogenedentes bacterium]|nr:beta-ketoacyl-ACP synthase III [Candidatus Hydrogenedentota bacterium]HRK34105.1 beta-ketoacyl-ACP synthase III [Candidatus Hydrogenedentota bacterium]
MLRARIIGTGHYLPERVLTNSDLEHLMDTTDEWIRQRTGILQRHIAADDEAASDLAAHASSRALERAGIAATDVDYIICATLTPDYFMPSSACLVQHKVGAFRAGACDINAACSGFMYGVQQADALIRAGVHKTILVIGTEIMTARLDWTKRDTAVLFGDGAGAVVLRGDTSGAGILSTYTASDGSGYDVLMVPAGGSAQVITPENINELNRGILMNGRELYKRAVHAFGDAVEQALLRAGVQVDDLRLFVPHQANRRIIVAAAERVGLPEEKIYLNVDRVANTSAASIPIALDQAYEEGRLAQGNLVLLAAFGAGLTWGSAVVKW